MVIKAAINSNREIRTKYNNSNQQMVVRNIGLPADAAGRYLSTLLDVDIGSSPSSNDVLVYSSITGKYELKVLPEIDGGTF